ncbi:prokaryotic ubiquitin-like protein Pup [Sanguibacter gelidistatuariae]|uniref:Prokaryotic ubiquitin-like protein Pup n=1 Tax=Sanguibacter gelidistatuariae TaxID=1814289 RepID=A0A1G6TDX1_9MICO|nr:ubiquitin-like protein Pup [Sanguibacter gelidistatuariae]SDD27253.1 prokaryotic ubiquitin-like protein Pup [Sanguibacter gelidistatuariae]
MASQEHQQHASQDREPDEVDPAPAPVAAAQTRDTEVDALLDEIDDVLEINAESFVRGFVQKGGQ